MGKLKEVVKDGVLNEDSVVVGVVCGGSGVTLESLEGWRKTLGV
jgi:hypothetical protein